MDRQKTGGRQKGTGNKTTSEIRAKLQVLIDTTVQEVLDQGEWQSEITLKEKMDFIAKIIPYVLSRPTHEEAQRDSDPPKIEIIYPS